MWPEEPIPSCSSLWASCCEDWQEGGVFSLHELSDNLPDYWTMQSRSLFRKAVKVWGIRTLFPIHSKWPRKRGPEERRHSGEKSLGTEIIKNYNQNMNLSAIFLVSYMAGFYFCFFMYKFVFLLFNWRLNVRYFQLIVWYLVNTHDKTDGMNSSRGLERSLVCLGYFWSGVSNFQGRFFDN